MDRVKYEYAFCVNYDSEDFGDKCSAYLSEGWIAQGGVSTTTFNGLMHYAQAFVREVPREGDE